MVWLASDEDRGRSYFGILPKKLKLDKKKQNKTNCITKTAIF
jgi:hypothetical protein